MAAETTQVRSTRSAVGSAAARRRRRDARAAAGPARAAAVSALAAVTAFTALTGCAGSGPGGPGGYGGSGAAAPGAAGPAARAGGGAVVAASRAADGADADPRSPAGTVAGAADALVRAGSSRVTTSMRMASGGTWLTITGAGGFDFADRRGVLRLLLPRDAAGTREHKPITELLTPGALYMKDRGEGVPAGKWVRVDTARLPDGNLVTGGATDPLAAAELLRGAQDVAYAGREIRDGVEVRHYRGAADIARAAAAADPAARGPLLAAAKGFTVTRVPFDAWLDGRGRLRRLVQRFTFSAAGARRGAGRDVTVVSTTCYDGFGAPVSMIMPRPADIWAGKIVSPQAP